MMAEDKDLRCPRCGRKGATDFHQCPYALDVDDDPNVMCNCCEECTQDCADEI